MPDVRVDLGTFTSEVDTLLTILYLLVATKMT